MSLTRVPTHTSFHAVDVCLESAARTSPHFQFADKAFDCLSMFFPWLDSRVRRKILKSFELENDMTFYLWATVDHLPAAAVASRSISQSQ